MVKFRRMCLTSQHFQPLAVTAVTVVTVVTVAPNPLHRSSRDPLVPLLFVKEPHTLRQRRLLNANKLQVLHLLERTAPPSSPSVRFVIPLQMQNPKLAEVSGKKGR